MRRASGPLMAVAKKVIWTPTGADTVARYAAGVALASNGKVYRVGGYDGAARVQTNTEYDPATGLWTARTGLGVVRNGLGVASPINGKVYAFGGTDGASTYGTIYEYDPSTNAAWVLKSSVSPVLRQYAAVFAWDKYVYTMGGMTGTNVTSTVASSYRYDTVNNTWAARLAMPAALNRASVAVVGASAYVVGGRTTAGTAQAGLRRYDMSTNTWSSSLSNCPYAVYGAQMVALSSGKLLLVGGYDSIDGRSPYAQLYDPSTDTWVVFPAADIPVATGDHDMVTLPDGSVLLAGGVTDSGATASVYRNFLAANY